MSHRILPDNQGTILTLVIIVTLILTACSNSHAAPVSPTDTPALAETPLPIPLLPPERSTAERQAAVAAIRAFAGAPDLNVNYLATSLHPENSLMVVEEYETADAQFLVDIQDNRLVIIQLNDPASASSGKSSLPNVELEQKAEEFLHRQVPCFPDAESRLQYSFNNKGKNYFFRWQSPLPNAGQTRDQPTFVQVSMTSDGNIYGYTDSGICYLDLAHMSPIPTLTEIPVPTSEPVPATLPPAAGYEGWQSYTNQEHGFSFRYPLDWTLDEDLRSDSTSTGHLLWLKPQSNPNFVLAVGFKRAGEDVGIKRTGIGSGELETRGTTGFLGQDVQHVALVCLGKDMGVYYNRGGEIQRGNLVFTLNLDYVGSCTDSSALTETVEGIADQIVASFQMIK